MNCDRIAHAYRWLEYAAFGRSLERHRVHHLRDVKQCSRALLLGDGDGRFLAQLASANPGVQIDSIDVSAGMLLQARKRLAGLPVANSSRIRLSQGDAFKSALAANSYDLVVTNFLFDCFSSSSVAELVRRVVPACTAKALWIVSEFRQPEVGWEAWHARLWLAAMYGFFNVATGLQTRHLPDHASALRRADFRLLSNSTSRRGLICSELWQRSS